MTAHVSHNSRNNNEWYTPEKYTSLVRATLGRIDLDPASCEFANQTVRATKYYDIETDGLKQEWVGRIFLNPPYGNGIVQKFADKLVAEFNYGNIKEAIALVNNASETKWFGVLADNASAICFPRKRIRFETKDGKKKTPLQGQAFLYFGENPTLFIAVFESIGHVLVKAEK